MKSVIYSGRAKRQTQIVPITYYEASLLYIDYRAPFSFLHKDPIDGSTTGKVTMLDPVTYIPSILWDKYEMCYACGEFQVKYHKCEGQE